MSQLKKQIFKFRNIFQKLRWPEKIHTQKGGQPGQCPQLVELQNPPQQPALPPTAPAAAAEAGGLHPPPPTAVASDPPTTMTNTSDRAAGTGFNSPPGLINIFFKNYFYFMYINYLFDAPAS